MKRAFLIALLGLLLCGADGTTSGLETSVQEQFVEVRDSVYERVREAQ